MSDGNRHGSRALVYLVAGAAHDGGEHGPGGVVSGEASLHQAGAVVTHEGGGLIVVTHVCGFWRKVRGGEFTYRRYTGEKNNSSELFIYLTWSFSSAAFRCRQKCHNYHRHVI